METKRFLNVQELKEYIHVSESYVYKKVMKNQIPYLKLGRKTLFDINQIDVWVINGGVMKEDLPILPEV
jgi:excisionase family DNA binding protein